MKIKKIVAVTCVVGAILGLGVSLVRAETLREALVQAYQNNPTLLAERARLRSTDEEISQAVSGWRPTVSITSDAGYQNRSRTTTGSSKTSDSTLPRGATLSIEQTIYNGGQTSATIQRAENLVQSDRARLLRTEQSILLGAVTEARG